MIVYDDSTTLRLLPNQPVAKSPIIKSLLLGIC